MVTYVIILLKLFQKVQLKLESNFHATQIVQTTRAGLKIVTGTILHPKIRKQFPKPHLEVLMNKITEGFRIRKKMNESLYKYAFSYI